MKIRGTMIIEVEIDTEHPAPMAAASRAIVDKQEGQAPFLMVSFATTIDGYPVEVSELPLGHPDRYTALDDHFFVMEDS